jgi:fibrillarin-like pre-rRNA processing protein
MKKSNMDGILLLSGKLYTENLKIHSKIYNEKLVNINGKEYRSWNPFRSKLAAAIHNGLNINITSNSKILYLGAATGTTVSHISDIVKDSVIYAVENSPIALKNLLKLSQKRANIIPILADANHPDKYISLISVVDIVYQDISQRNQADIFIKNIIKYLKKGGTGILMVKARSIDVSLKPKDAYKQVTNFLKKNGFNIESLIDLAPYEKDHIAIVINI